VSGNVSLYNETKAEDGSSLAILPTPAIGGVGLLDDWEKSATIGFKAEGEALYLLGGRCRHLSNSLWLREIYGVAAGPPPAVDLGAERRVGELLRDLIARGLVTAVHDVSDGGVLVATAEMALAGEIGIDIDSGWVWGLDTRPTLEADFFGEDQGRILVASKEWDLEDSALLRLSREAGVPLEYVGRIGGDSICIGDCGGGHVIAEVSLTDLRAAHEGFFPKLMGRELTPEF
jgi:phosphoribosylformylglycinamidine synthase